MQNFDQYRIDGHAMRIFVSICETHSLSRTATLFNVNQSTISHTLDKMRNAIGDPLFVKAGRGITPTQKALMIMPRIQQILSDIEGLTTPEQYDPMLDRRPVVVAIPTPALLEDMRRMHALVNAAAPTVTFEIRRLAPRDRVHEMLVQDEAELAIAVSGFKYPPTLNHCDYGVEQPVVFYDPSHRGPIRSIEDYASARHGVVNFGGNVKSQVEIGLEDRGLSRSIALVAPTASMLGDLIMGTDIIATMPQRLADGAYSRLAQCPTPLNLPDIRFDLVWHRRYENSGRNRWLRELALSARRACAKD